MLLKRKYFVIALVLTSLVQTGIMTPLKEAKAIFFVDLVNLVENILQVMNSLASNINEATQIANQLTSIDHEIQNLRGMNPTLASSLLTQYVTLYSQLNSEFATIDGLAKDVTNLTAKYDAAYPNAPTTAKLDTVAVLGQVQSWLTQTRRTYKGVYAMSGQVMQNLPQAQSQITNILAQSQASSGNLDAIQASTQMQAQVASQLLQLNSQNAAMYQAQTDWMAQQTQMLSNSKKVSSDAGVGYNTPGIRTPMTGVPNAH